MTRPLAPLPIDDVRSALDEALRGKRPVLVGAPTGSGKSTRIPIWAAELGAELGEGPVLVVEPRRVACRALADYLAQCLGEEVGHRVGYRVRFANRIGKDTRVWFCTPGVALNLAAEAEGLARFSAVVVDEFHERGWEGDLLVALVRAASAGPRGPTLVLCSATLDLAALQQRLDAVVVESKGRSFPVEIVNAGDDIPNDRELEERVAQAVRGELANEGGDVLVFLPGKGEIERVRRALADVPAEVMVLHGSVAPDRAAEALRKGRGRRVILATNIAETSLTIPGVTVVVDSGLARMRLHRGGRAALSLVPISDASMQQRAGRAGRVAPGRCVRLWSARYEAAGHTSPEIERVELDDLVLRAGAAGLWGSALASAPWVTPPPEFALREAVDRLRRNGALDAEGRPTQAGARRASIPVSETLARVLAAAPPSLVGDLCDIAAIVEARRDPLLPAHDPEVDRARAELFEGCAGEVEVRLQVLRKGDARRHVLHRGGLEQMRKLATSLRKRLGAESIRGGGVFDRDALVTAIVSAAPETAFVRRERATKKGRGGPDRPAPWGNGLVEVGVRPYRVPGVDSDRQPKPPSAGALLDVEWLGTGKGARGFGGLLLPCAPRVLARAGIGEVDVGPPKLEGKGRSRKVVAATQCVHAGVVIDERSGELEGVALVHALGQLIARGSLRKGLATKVADDLHDWDLLAQFVSESGATLEPPPEDRDVAPFLSARLLDQGVETFDDLSLLEDEDLRPGVEGMVVAAGIDPRELVRLREDFPRIWRSPVAPYGLRVSLARKLVTLEPGDHRKGLNEPDKGHLPRFRGFRVEFVRGSRKVKLR